MSTCSSAQLIENDKGALGSVLDDVAGMPQFHLREYLSNERCFSRPCEVRLLENKVGALGIN